MRQHILPVLSPSARTSKGRCQLLGCCEPSQHAYVVMTAHEAALLRHPELVEQIKADRADPTRAVTHGSAVPADAVSHGAQATGHTSRRRAGPWMPPNRRLLYDGPIRAACRDVRVLPPDRSRDA